ncbi:MAG: ABC transporter ATP-binding protein [Candidatus Sumerlaeaceae bacterium]
MADVETLIEGRNISKQYVSAERTVRILESADFQINSGEFVALVGRSGVGKTTVLNLLGGLDRPNSGELLFSGTHLETMDDAGLSAFRNKTVGFIFQSFFLRSLRSAMENVMVPLLFGEMSVAQARQRARVALGEVGLGQLVNSPANRLSGGQKQRVAIARAIANQPRLILADEPTGSLDTATSMEIYELLLNYNRSHGTTIVVVTHDPLVEQFGVRKLTIEDGRLVPYLGTI